MKKTLKTTATGHRTFTLAKRLMPAGFALAWLGFGTAIFALQREDSQDAALAGRVKQLCRSYIAGFGSDQTHLVYHCRLDGPGGIDALASPAEIAAGTVRGRPLPYGYGSGIQDMALENGQFLYALCEAHRATGDPELARMAGWVFQGLRLVATVSPEPGFVPRGPHPDGKSYYADSSRDQHAAMAEALWRYGRSSLATDDDRRFIARELDEMARRLQRNGWAIMVEDGGRVAHVGFTWKQSTSIGAVSLLSFLAMTADATDDPHWRRTYREFSEEKDGFRWNELLAPEVAGRWKPFTLYSNQFSQALAVLCRSEADEERRRRISQLLENLARRAMHSNVFDPAYWRRLDWAGEASEDRIIGRLRPLGLTPDRQPTVVDLFDAFDPGLWQPEKANVRYLGDKLLFGIPTAAFHKALLADDDELIGEIAPHVRRMVDIMLEHGQGYHVGENFNRTVVLGLLLLAAESRGANTESPTGDSAGQADSANGEELSMCGEELSILNELGVGACMDAEVVGRMLYVIGRGKLHVADVSDAASPKLVGSLGGLGHVRQLCVKHGVAYVTAREDGLFLVDVTTPDRPRLLSHYDTVELATGIAVSGDVAFVACRTAGVELVDVSDPAGPRHLSTVRTGEAQSVDARDGILYAGVWGSLELVVCDASDPRKPSLIARAELDGYGDGVDVRGDYCYVATGHHSRESPRKNPGDPGYGKGHGLEIFDVSDPARPQLVGRVKFPPLYRLGMDMWGVTATDGHAFVADTYNGVFVVDISDPSEPRIVARRQLPLVEGRDDPSPVGGFAVGDGTIYAAGAWSDLHVIEAPMARHVLPEADRAAQIPPPAEPEPDPRFRVYKPGGQVHAVAFDGDVAFVAAGMDGLHAVSVSAEIERLQKYPSDGFAFGAAVFDRKVYVAEGTGGLSIWEHSGHGKLEPKGRYRAENESIRQVVVPPPGRFAILHVGPSTLHILNVTDPANPVRVLRDSQLGLFYCSPLPQGLLDDRYTCCHWHVSGLYWYDLTGETPKPTGRRYPFRIGSRNGVAFFDGRALATCLSGYALLSPDESRPPDELPIQRIPKLAFHGKPTVEGTMLYVSDRYTGRVTAIDIADPTNPQLTAQIDLPEHPGLVVVHNGVPVIPAGYQGLVIWEEWNGD